MPSSLLGIGTAVPPFAFSQQQVAYEMALAMDMSEQQRKWFTRLNERVAIDTRYSVLQDFSRASEEWTFWGHEFPGVVPGMDDRNTVYKDEAPKLATKAATAAITQWGGSCEEITHVISVSCTGMMAPGIEALLIEELGLRFTVERFAINFMGCFGAFRGLALADALVAEDPAAKVLLVCTELCSLHMQAKGEPEILIGNALFADGAAAVVVGEEAGLLRMVKRGTEVFPNTRGAMTWEPDDDSYVMRLTKEVPVTIRRRIGAFVERLRGTVLPENCSWAIHPGGPAILHAIEKACGLTEADTSASREVLRNYGNMSSPTFLFVLKECLRREQKAPFVLGLGFGPGLAVEGVLLEWE